jgi:hypothetical protein
VAAGGLHVEDGDLGLGPRPADDLEELALAVGLHVQGDDARRAAAAGRPVGDLQACADAGELGVEELRVHKPRARTRRVVFAANRLIEWTIRPGVEPCKSFRSTISS